MPARQDPDGAVPAADGTPGAVGGASLRAEQVQATRAAILEAARQAFGARGYAATTLDEVAEAARVTKGAVYHHFGSKKGLFLEVYREVEGAVQARTATAGDPGGTATEQIIQGVAAYLDAVLDPAVQRITLVDGQNVLGPEPEGPDEDRPEHQGLRAFVAQAIAAGEIVPVDPDALTHLIRGACLQAGILIARSDDQVAARRRLGATLDALVGGLAVRRR